MSQTNQTLEAVYPPDIALERARALATTLKDYDPAEYGRIWDEAVQLVGYRRSLMHHGVSDLDIEVATLDALKALIGDMPARLQVFTALLAFGVPMDLLRGRAA